MHLLGPTNVMSGDYIPFTNVIANWAISGTDSLIAYNSITKHFDIPFASMNDYYITWQIALMTANIAQHPILSLELTYNNVTRSDTMISPMKTQEIVNSSIFHITHLSSSDILSIGLKVIGDASQIYFLDSNSTVNISANIIILGL